VFCITGILTVHFVGLNHILLIFLVNKQYSNYFKVKFVQNIYKLILLTKILKHARGSLKSVLCTRLGTYP